MENMHICAVVNLQTAQVDSRTMRHLSTLCITIQVHCLQEASHKTEDNQNVVHITNTKLAWKKCKHKSSLGYCPSKLCTNGDPCNATTLLHLAL
jgi:hypothetical protein